MREGAHQIVEQRLFSGAVSEYCMTLQGRTKHPCHHYVTMPSSGTARRPACVAMSLPSPHVPQLHLCGKKVLITWNVPSVDTARQVPKSAIMTTRSRVSWLKSWQSEGNVHQILVQNCFPGMVAVGQPDRMRMAHKKIDHLHTGQRCFARNCEGFLQHFFLFQVQTEKSEHEISASRDQQ